MDTCFHGTGKPFVALELVLPQTKSCWNLLETGNFFYIVTFFCAKTSVVRLDTASQQFADNDT
jgi:hypothetical protein